MVLCGCLLCSTCYTRVLHHGWHNKVLSISVWYNVVAVYTSDSNSVPLCNHSILNSPIIWEEDVALGGDSHSEDSRFFCAPGHASHVMDLVQQSDAGNLNDSLPGQLVLSALRFLPSSD